MPDLKEILLLHVNSQLLRLNSGAKQMRMASINDIRLNTTAGIVLSNFIVSLSPNLPLSYALKYEL